MNMDLCLLAYKEARARKVWSSGVRDCNNISSVMIDLSTLHNLHALSLITVIPRIVCNHSTIVEVRREHKRLTEHLNMSD